MNSFRLTALFALSLAAFLAGASYFSPSWAREAGLDVWSLSTLREEIADTECDERELDCDIRAVTQRNAIRGEVVKGVVEGRLSLEEAGHEFLELNRAIPGRVETMRSVFPAPSDEESAQLQVLSFVRVYLAASAAASEPAPPPPSTPRVAIRPEF